MTVQSVDVVGCSASNFAGSALTVPSVYSYVHQRSTHSSVRRGLVRLSAFALQGVPCVCPATSLTMAEGSQGRHADVPLHPVRIPLMPQGVVWIAIELP